jgi:Flp pilus assembly protein TadD
MTGLCRRLSAVCAILALSLPALEAVRAQSPRHSTLAPTPQTRPQDSAQAALKAGDPQRALEISDTALKTFPQDAQLRFIRGVSLHMLNRLPEAETVFATMTQEFPELPEPYNNLAVVRAAQGKLDGARVALEEALRAVPNYAVAYENLGDVHAQLAARNYRSAQKLDPANRNLAPKLKLVSEVIAQASTGQTSSGQTASGEPSSGRAPAAQNPPQPSRSPASSRR